MKLARLMFLYAAFLVITAGLAFALAPDKSKAMTAIYAGGGAALVMAICGLLATRIRTNRFAGMVGIHLGLVLPLILAVVFGIRSYKNLSAGDSDKRYLGIILAVMAAGSVAASGMILATRPKAEDRG